MNNTFYSTPTRSGQFTRFLYQHWFFMFSFVMGLYVILPFFGPVFMQIGWTGAGRVIYFIYSWLCHQFPERSYFLFGPKLTFTIKEIQNAWQNTTNPWILRQFIGNADMGWKVAWSDRMVAMFTSVWIFGMLWWLMRSRMKPLPWWGLLLFLLPVAVDGTTHFLSDLGGIRVGFRGSNAWLAVLTNYSLPASFYAGDAWGSFNSLMRLITGILFGMGSVWFSFPYLERAFSAEISPGPGTFPRYVYPPATTSNPKESL